MVSVTKMLAADLLSLFKLQGGGVIDYTCLSRRFNSSLDGLRSEELDEVSAGSSG